MQIAKILTADRVLIVTAYHARQKDWAMPENLYQWCAKSVRDIGAAGVHRLYRELQDLYQVLEIKKRMETRLRTRKYSRTPSPPSSRKASENGYRSCGGTNAGRPRQEPAFFPGLSTALTAGPSCTSAPATLTRMTVRTILSAPTTRAIPAPAKSTISGNRCFTGSYWRPSSGH